MYLNSKNKHAPERFDLKESFKPGIVTPILVMFVFALIVSVNFIPQFKSLGVSENPYIVAIVINILAYALPTAFYCILRGRKLMPFMRFRFPKFSSLLYIFHITVFVICGVALLSVLGYKMAPEAFSGTSITSSASFAMSGGFFNEVYIIFAFALIPAFAEEVLFRGVVLTEYEQSGVIFASVMSALMFAMSHFSLPRLPVYIFSGLVLSAAVFATRSLITAILIHAVNNIAVIYSERFILKIIDRENESTVLMLVILGAVLIISGMLSCFEARRIYSGYSEANEPTDRRTVKKQGFFMRFAENFVSPTFLALIIIFILFTVVIK